MLLFDPLQQFIFKGSAANVSITGQVRFDYPTEMNITDSCVCHMTKRKESDSNYANGYMKIRPTPKTCISIYPTNLLLF